ncbi:ribulokinase [Sorangium cellulosum]|uniref:Ribulokinase n=1 Tax=Sorangium cellulosum TaxID=56 RepID=A0A4P2QF98_SORCE|nr:ribulokinase [Sorangium cellulosum]AUX27873.1 ribulokinase [Sorangium cellulosum]
MRAGTFVIGIDFGTDSVRSVVADARDGEIAGVAVAPYARWAQGLYCDPRANRFRQHPLDYLEALEVSVRSALRQAGGDVASRVRGIAVDTTGSTPVLAGAKGTPLALCAGFEEDPDAMFILWKDHTAVAEAARINHVARTWGGVDYTKFSGGVYSAEWFWAKALHVIEANPTVARAAVTVLEHCDWIPAVLTGTTDLARIKRSRCAAGHKAMWHPEFDGYPSNEFLAKLNPRLPALRATLGAQTFTADTPFGTISPEWAARLGLPDDVVVAVGAFDAHMGAVGGDIRPHQLLKVMGTSTCDMLVVPKTGAPEILVAGICGQVDGSILPGAIGYEAGQSAFGDVFAWFKQLLGWPLRAVLPALPCAGESSREALADAVRRAALADALLEEIIPALERAAAAIPPSRRPVLALDWLNGRRTPDADQRLRGAIAGLDLATDAPRIYRALVEAVAFGSRAIVERFRSQGIRIDGAIGIGGVARKSPLTMQVLADVLDMTVEVRAGEQPVALGAAMFAATAAGLHAAVEDAQRAMAPETEARYRPDPARARLYDALYRDYIQLGSFVERELTQQGYHEEST